MAYKGFKGFIQAIGDIGTGFIDGIKYFGKKAGDLFNDVTGQTARMEKQQAFNSAEAQKQRDWETEMSNSAHQREVADMKASGLNPILSSGGNGANIHSGASASVGTDSPGNPFSAIASVISSAASLANNKNIDRETTQQIYNSAGNLMKTVETWTR